MPGENNAANAKHERRNARHFRLGGCVHGVVLFIVAKPPISDQVDYNTLARVHAPLGRKLGHGRNRIWAIRIDMKNGHAQSLSTQDQRNSTPGRNKAKQTQACEVATTQANTQELCFTLAKSLGWGEERDLCGVEVNPI